MRAPSCSRGGGSRLRRRRADARKRLENKKKLNISFGADRLRGFIRDLPVVFKLRQTFPISEVEEVYKQHQVSWQNLHRFHCLQNLWSSDLVLIQSQIRWVWESGEVATTPTADLLTPRAVPLTDPCGLRPEINDLTPPTGGGPHSGRERLHARVPPLHLHQGQRT